MELEKELWSGDRADGQGNKEPFWKSPPSWLPLFLEYCYRLQLLVNI